jgi:diguanylate cyclase (GGDEF)-like protein
MFLDVDRFKVINDSLGHTVGDALLVAFAHRLAAVVRPEDTVARFGGDEFVVLCEDVRDEAAVRALAKRITASLDEPFLVLSGGEVFLTASIGLAIDDDHPRAAESLLRDADAAMYRAKENGRDRLEVFDAEMRAASMLRLSLENDLRRALTRDDLVMHYQPTVDLATGAIIGAEALIRWNHPTRGLLGPDEFIPVAEDTGLVVPIGFWALEQALTDARRLVADPSQRPFQLAVNLSGRQLTVAHLVEDVAGLLTRHAWPPDQLCLELTESMITDDIEPAVEMLVALKALGLLLAIDDFGTGYSSLTRLHRLPVDIVKVDQTFVAGLQTDDDRHAIVTAIVRMVHALGLRTSAEGIETAGQLAELQALGCDWGQGFLFSQALPVEEFALLLADPPAW